MAIKPNIDTDITWEECTIRAKVFAFISSSPNIVRILITKKCQAPIPPCTGNIADIEAKTKEISPTFMPKSSVKGNAKKLR